jgi:hypothetical protein
MKKTVIVVFALAATITIAGCGKTNQNQSENKNQGTKMNQETEQQQGGVVSSIKDAMGLGKKMKCTYRYTFGDQTTESVAYIDGKKYKSSYDIGNQKTNSYFDGEMSYTWTEGQKTGTKISMACLKEIGEKYKDDGKSQNQNKNQFKAGEDAFKDTTDTKCEPTNEDLSLPAGITFTDQCEQTKAQMQSMQEMMKKYQNMAPNGNGVGSGAGNGALPN